MASKKIKKALGAALLGFGAAKAMSAMGAAKKAKIAAAQVDTGDLGSEMANDTALASAMRKSMLPKKKPISKSSGADFMGYGDTFGLGPYDGAKEGKMIKAKNGVMARGCKLGRNKRTIIT
jgi:hypothetical protein